MHMRVKALHSGLEDCKLNPTDCSAGLRDSTSFRASNDLRVKMDIQRLIRDPFKEQTLYVIYALRIEKN